MRKWFFILALALPLAACVGQKDDPETPGQGTEIGGPGGSETGTVFYRQVLAVGFTATWCQYCPVMADALGEAARTRPGRIIPLAVHYQDELSPDEANSLSDDFFVSTYPSLLFDMNPETLFNGQDASAVVSYVDEAIKKTPCGLAAEARVSASTLSLEVKVKAVRSATYTVAAAWAEDGVVVAHQSGYGPSYVCNAVLRGYLQPGTKGKSLGALQAGQEGSAELTTPMPENAGNKYLVVYVMEDGIVMNALTIQADQTQNYLYEKTNSTNGSGPDVPAGTSPVLH